MKRLLLLMFVYCFCTLVEAHVVINTEYILEKGKNDTWILRVKTKTSAIHDKLVLINPQLKGINLNSDRFKNNAFNYFKGCIDISANGQPINLQSEDLTVGGHYAEAIFNMGKWLNKTGNMQFSISCFTDSHMHIANEVTIDYDDVRKTFQLMEGQERIQYFFDTEEFKQLGKEKELPSYYKYAAFIVSLIIIVAIVILIGIKPSSTDEK